ncbi:MAG: hemerythrin domain-containing protein [Desulfobacteraceae bacterium]|nr:MAG: hemerythrin domain-containing protein [Desulfobacteraceae bacterium]
MAHEFFQTLEKDHEEVKAILEKLESASDGAVKTKEDLFLKLKQELIPHMKGEEKHFYPALNSKKEVKELSMQAIEEHHVAETVLKELEKLPKSAENWSAKVQVFKEIVEHHIEEEEEEVFEAAEDALDEEDLDRIMTSFEEEKEKAKKKIK